MTTLHNRTSRAALILALLTTTVALTALAPGAARAGTYSTYSCHLPDGTPTNTDGWQPISGYLWESEPDHAGVLQETINACNVPGGTDGLVARIDPHLFPGQDTVVGWLYEPPAGTSIAGFVAHRCLLADWTTTTGGGGFGWGAGASISWPGHDPNYAQERVYGSDSIRGCSGQYTGRDQLDTGPLTGETSRVFFQAWCGQADCSKPVGCPWGPESCAWLPQDVASARVYEMLTTLRDEHPPTVSAVTGPLASTADHAGNEQVSFDAADQGGGVYRAIAEAKIHGAGDWHQLAARIIDPADRSCQPLNVTDDAYQFREQVPCPLSVTGATLSVDTTQLPAGDHTLRVQVEDAAGNRTDVIAPRTFHVNGPQDDAKTSSATPRHDDQGPPSAAPAALTATNGDGATRTAILTVRGASQVRAAYGKAVTIKGALADDQGHPIAGATVQVRDARLIPKTESVHGSWSTLGQVTTTKTGTWTARIPSGTSRRLQLIYRANPSDPGYTSTAQLSIIVAAHLTARAKSTHVRNHHTATITGTVHGPLPAGGVLVSLQVKERGRGWIPVATTRRSVHTGKKGTYRLAYQFANTYTKATFSFRVAVNEDSAFPYDQGSSKTITIHVRP